MCSGDRLCCSPAIFFTLSSIRCAGVQKPRTSSLLSASSRGWAEPVRLLQVPYLFFPLHLRTLRRVVTHADQIGSGVSADLFRPRERGKAIAVCVMARLLGGLVGPIAGGFLDQYVLWPWCFYVMSITNGGIPGPRTALLPRNLRPCTPPEKMQVFEKDHQ